MENWRRFVIKENEEKLKEFYHASQASFLESFKSGIDIQKGASSEDTWQGSGFYVFASKEKALNHAKQLADPDSQTTKFGDMGDGGGIIVVIDPPLTPENFDIDYEHWNRVYLQFLLDNLDYVWQNKEALSIHPKASRNRFEKHRMITFQTPLFPRVAYKVATPQRGMARAKVLQKSADGMAETYPDLFRRFEEQALPSAAVLKYNGTEKIFPLRIEDLEGNIIWSRN
tara:strand:- start:966 stop:1649 length:684 start_codon:yes stop_codon:yes gene_type:complete